MFKYGSSGRLDEKSKRYQSLQDFLVDNPLIREGVQFDLEVENNVIQKGTYEFKGASTVINIQTGQEYPANSAVFNGRNNVKVKLANEIEVMAMSRINRASGKNVLSFVSQEIDKKVFSTPMSQVEIADLASEISRGSERKGKLFRDALFEQAELTSRRVSHSLDFEAYIGKEREKIAFDNIFSAGFAETTEDIYTMKGDSTFLGGLKSIKKYKDKAVNVFDITKSIELIKNPTDANIYGKQNFALLYDNIRAFVSGESKAPDWMDPNVFERSRAQVISQLGPVAERIKSFQKLNTSDLLRDDVPKEYMDKFESLFADGMTDPFKRKEEGRNRLVSFLETIQQRTNNFRDKQLNSLRDGQSAHMVYGEFSLGVVDRQLDSKRDYRSYQEEVRFSNNLMGSVTNRINKSKSKFSSFGNAEYGAFRGKRLELESELKAKEGHASPVELENIRAAILELNKSEGSITDMKSKTEMLFDRLLPDIKRNLSDSSVGATRALEKLVPASIMERIHQSGTLSFIGEKGKGLSVETLYQIMSGSEAQEYHTGGMDSSDLNHIKLLLEDSLSSANRYKSKTTKRIKGTSLKGVTDNEYSMVDFSATVSRKIQQKVLTNAVLKEASTEQLVNMLTAYKPKDEGIVRLAGEFNVLKNMESSEQRLKQELDIRKSAGQTLEKIITAQMDRDFNSTSRQYKEHMRTLNKYSTDNPGLIAKSLSRPGMARVAAMASFLWMTRTNAEDDPGASIETGEHNSMQTVARRIATTPFNSAISLGAVGRFAGRILSRFKKSGFTSTDELFQNLKTNRFSKLQDYEIENIQKRALMPAFSSAETRLVNKSETVKQMFIGTDMPTSRSQKMIADRMIRNNLSVPSVDRRLKESINYQRLERWNTLKSDSLFTVSESPRYTSTQGFFLGSTGPHDKASSLGLSFEKPGRDVFIDQSRVFDFMKSNNAVSMADDALIDTRKQTISKLIEPSFNINWTGKLHSSKSKISNTSLNDVKFMPYNQEVKTPNINFDQDTTNVSSTMLGMKSKKYNKYIEFGKTETNSNNYYDYPNTLMNVTNNKKDITNGANSLIYSDNNRRRPERNFLTLRKPIENTSNPVIVKGKHSYQEMAPIHHKDKAFNSAVMPMVRQPKRLDPNDYINDANMMLIGKGGFQTSGNYPATTGQVMGYINNLANRY